MNMKIMRKGFAILLVVLMIVSLTGVALAAQKYEGNTTASTTNSLTEVTGTAANKTSFKKFLIVPAGVTVPNVTYSFTIAPGAAVSTTTTPDGQNDVMMVLAGVGTPTIGTAVFTQTDTLSTDTTGHSDLVRTASDRKTGDTADIGVEFESSKGEQFAVKTVEISFEGVTFVEPGIYRYTITENAAAAGDNTIHDTDTDRTLDVYVHDNNGALEIAGYVLHKGTEDVAINATMGSDGSAAQVGKTDGFTNEYKPVDLAFSKTVTGNQGSRDKYFKFTLTVPGLTAADTFVVSLADDNDANTNDGNADATPTGNNATIHNNMSNPPSVTGSQLASGVDFYLQHGQSIVVRGLPKGVSYTLKEVHEDYAPSVALTGDTQTGDDGTATATPTAITGAKDSTGATYDVTDSNLNQFTTVAFTNNRAGTIPTGILTVVGPAVAVIAVGAIGMGVVLAGKRKKDEEDD